MEKCHQNFPPHSSVCVYLGSGGVSQLQQGRVDGEDLLDKLGGQRGLQVLHYLERRGEITGRKLIHDNVGHSYI